MIRKWLFARSLSVFATSGAGKSYAIKLEILRSADFVLMSEIKKGLKEAKDLVDAAALLRRSTALIRASISSRPNGFAP